MTEEAKKDRKKPQLGETDGFRFAVTLLAAFGTVSYTAYNYLQDAAVDTYWYAFFCGIIAVTLILVIGLLPYILIKGCAMEVRVPGQKERLDGLASNIYLASFLTFVMLLVYLLLLLVLALKVEITPTISILVAIPALLAGLLLYGLFFKETTIIRGEIGLFLVIVLLLYGLFLKGALIYIVIVVPVIAISIILYCLLLIEKFKSFLLLIEKFKSFLIEKVKPPTALRFASVACWLAVAMIIWLIASQPILHSPLQGHVTVDMDSICYKDGTPIPVLIQVTGPNTGLSVYLSKEESGNNLTQKDLIEYLNPEHNEKRTVSGDNNSILSGNALGDGKYSVFINTTNLPTGYYEIKSVRLKYTEKYGVKGFYLLNNS